MTSFKPFRSTELTRLGWIWFGVLLLALAASWLLGWFDDATELAPGHDDVLTYCFWAAGVMAVVSAAIGFLQTKGKALTRAVTAVLLFGLVGGIATFLLSATAADILENRADFPAGVTQTRWALLPIARAYRTEGKSRSWVIQPLIWSNIDISEADYRVMLPRAARNGEASEPTSVRSDGTFCAKVEIQQSGRALRVLHAGRQTLPAGTVGICAVLRARDPSLPVIQ